MSNFLPLMVRHILELTEWNAHEIGVYSVLLEKGAMNLSRIALETNLGTSSVQYALKNLHARKMVTKFLMNSQPRWKAKEVEALHRWYKGQSKQFSMNETAIQQFVAQYDFHPDGSTPNVEFREGVKAVKKSLQEICERSTSKSILMVALLNQSINPELLQFMKEGCASLRANGMEVRILIAGDMALAGSDVRRMNGEYFRKAMHLSDGSSAMLLIVDGAVYAIDCQKGACLMLIEYPLIADMLRVMFECIWNGGHD